MVVLVAGSRMAGPATGAGRLAFLHGREVAEAWLPELERILKVQHAHKPPARIEQSQLTGRYAWRPCCRSLAQVSLRVTVRSNTGWPGVESGSAQK